MVTNYYILRGVAADLDRRLAGCPLAEAFTQHRNELVLRFVSESPDDPLRTDSEFLVIGCEPSLNAIHARSDFHRAGKNTVDLFADLAGKRVDHVSIHPADREIRIRLDDGFSILVQMFGPKANVLVLDGTQLITDAFLRKSLVVGNRYAGSTATEESRTLTPERLNDVAVQFPAMDLYKGVKRFVPHFGGTLVREALHRSSLPEARTCGTLTSEESSRILSVLHDLERALVEHPEPRIYFDSTAPVELSLVPLQHLPQFREERFPSVHAAIRTFLSSARRSDSFLGSKDRIDRALVSEREHLERTLEKISAEAPKVEEADRLELLGKLLTANLHDVSKGMTEILVENTIAGTDEIVEIRLDPHLTPARNAARYFDKSRKVREGVEEQARRQLEISGRLQRAIQLLELLAPVESADDLKTFQREHEPMLREFRIGGSSGAPERIEQPLFRIFTVEGGFQVWAGKSSENNDLLTTRHTAKNDLWFHARGVGGSHVVLKVGTGTGAPSKHAIGQAASIAAYYSKMKNASMVPVAMCEGKYVRKPKGVPAGTVHIERETMLYAEPALPEPERTPS